MKNRKQFKIIILAAGKGTRMGGELPKALMPLRGKPMIEHLLHQVALSGIDEKPTIVVGFEKEKVIEALGDKYEYAVQKEQLGTGNAVICTEEILKNKADHIMVLYCDHPYISSETIKKLADKHLQSESIISMATTLLPDFLDWREFFYNNFSRIIRDLSGNIAKDVQFKDANDEEKKITEVNPCYFCFEAKWLWDNIKTLKNNNAQHQYYLTDLIQIAMQKKVKIESINIDPREALAANSKTELLMLENFVLS